LENKCHSRGKWQEAPLWQIRVKPIDENSIKNKFV